MDFNQKFAQALDSVDTMTNMPPQYSAFQPIGGALWKNTSVNLLGSQQKISAHSKHAGLCRYQRSFLDYRPYVVMSLAPQMTKWKKNSYKSCTTTTTASRAQMYDLIRIPVFCQGLKGNEINTPLQHRVIFRFFIAVSVKQ